MKGNVLLINNYHFLIVIELMYFLRSGHQFFNTLPIVLSPLKTTTPALIPPFFLKTKSSGVSRKPITPVTAVHLVEVYPTTTSSSPLVLVVVILVIDTLQVTLDFLRCLFQ